MSRGTIVRIGRSAASACLLLGALAAPAGVIEVRVVEHGGPPVVGQRLELLPGTSGAATVWLRRAWAETDRAGLARFEGVAPGSYTAFGTEILP